MLFIDSTIVRAHQHSTGAQKKVRRASDDLVVGCRLHAAMDGLSNPVRLFLTGSEVADITPVQALIDGFEAWR